MKTTCLTPLVAFQVFTTAMLFTAPALSAKAPLSNPDFAKGGVDPADAKHDWTLGATGARAWIFSDRLSTSEARQIAITMVAKDSPADGVLNVGVRLPRSNKCCRKRRFRCPSPDSTSPF